MIRKLAIALSLLGACFTGFVHALGLGEVTVKSALNQPLNAEIELVNTAGLTVDEILPGLATREEFQKAKVDRVYFLSDLRFEVITSPQGKAIIVLTSKKPVREPFLNFIVELIWPSGRLLREYSLLIDPPLFSDSPTASVSPSSPKATEVTSGDVLSMPADSSPRSILAPVSNVQTGTYGATSANDTLWDIAIKARPNRGVSPQQVMLAIQDLNPNAFIDDNINKLKAGQVLRLPSIDEIKQRSQHQAIVGVIAQNEALSGKRTASVVQGSAANDTKSSSSVKTVNRNAGDELKLVVSDGGSSSMTNSANSGQSNQSGSGSANDLALTLEKLDKASIENKELNGRVSDLEEQLTTLQRLLTLKNDQLASIQSQMRNNELEKLKAENDSALEIEQLQGSDELQDTEAMAAGEPLPNEQLGSSDSSLGGSQEDSVAEESTEEMVEDAAVTGDGIAEETLTEAVTEPKVVAPAVNKVINPVVTQHSQNFIEMIILDPLYFGVALVSIILLMILLWFVSKNNARREEEFQSQNNYDEYSEEPFGSDSESNDIEDDEDASPIIDSFEEDEALETSEDTDDYPSESAGESQDILAEVNAYISYGRLDQASSVLEKAISSDPVRTDYRLKLLSIYKELGDRQAFDRQFSELEAIQDADAIHEAENIRDQIVESDASDLDLDDDLELQSSREIEDSLSDASVSEEPAELDEPAKSFDFDSVSLEEEEPELDLSSELDLDSLDVGDLGQEDADVLSTDTDDTLEIEDQLSLDSAVLELDTTHELEESNDFDDSILDVDLDDLDLNTELDQESEIPLGAQTEDQDLSVNDSSDDLVVSDEVLESIDSNDADDIEESNLADELVVSDDILEEATQAFEEEGDALDDSLSDEDDFDFLNGTDEASTKLDLARAYIDMGDIDGAKDILLEVAKEGSESQQTEAKELLDSLD